MIYKTIEMHTANDKSFKLKLEPMDVSTLEVKDNNTGETMAFVLDAVEMEALAKILQEGAKYEKEETV